MKHSHRSSEGYLMIDHRNSPGLPDEIVMAQGLPAGSGHGLFESGTISCHRCQALVVLNPLRTRERAYCPQHDAYLCDGCEFIRKTTGTCKTFAQVADEICEQAIRREMSIQLAI